MVASMPHTAVVRGAGAEGSRVDIARFGTMMTSLSGWTRVLTAHSTSTGSCTLMSSSTTTTRLKPAPVASSARMTLRASASWRLRMDTTAWCRKVPPALTLKSLTSGVMAETVRYTSAALAHSMRVWFSVTGMPVRQVS